MKAMVLKDFGGVENFIIEEIPEPQIQPNEVLVRVKAIGIDQIDIKTRKGSGMAPRYNKEQPIILGWDISGIVVKTGNEVEDFKISDEVFGTINFPGVGRSYAEYAVASTDQIARKPENITHLEAAAATQSPLTAWQALVDEGEIKEGDKILIHGAAGGVGNYAVQIARYFNTYVIGTARSEDKEFLTELGINQIIDYTTQRFDESDNKFDLILDTIGGENFERSLKVLKPEGRIVLLPSDKKEEAEKAAKKHNIKHYSHILMHSSGIGMKQIAEMLANNSMRVLVNKIFPFEQIPQAHQQMESGGNKGKIVIDMG
jgi:NADPH:quinone reductase-like Zn-dependent oxidoreductase